ncbi:trigger factor [Candidatus Bipolaricaulota bacterium]|nr:trigger factor [Candidatus Bipolaricaulota bacterium]
MTQQPHYEIKERAATEATVQVTVPSDAVRNQIEAVYVRYAKQMRVPGFRKGKVPRSFLDSRFGRDVFLEEAQDDLQRKHLSDALTKLSLRAVSVPQVDVVSFDETDAFVFAATFAVLPDVALADAGQLTVEVPANRAVSDEDVQRTLEEIQTQFGTVGEREGDTVTDGDIVRVREGEQEWDTRADGDNPVTRALIGVKVGDAVDVNTELPDGRPFAASFEVLGLRQIVMPEIDDELAKDAGFDDLETLKTDIRTKLGEQRTERHRHVVNGLILDALVGQTEIPLPESFVDDLLSEEIERLKTSLGESDAAFTFEDYLKRREMTEEELSQEIRESIVRRLKRELSLQQLAKDFEIAIDDEELGALAKADAEEHGEDPLRMVARLKAEEKWGDYRLSKINERIFNRLRETVTLKETEEEAT